MAMASHSRAVDAVANAIDAALDTWESDHAAVRAVELADSHAVADAIIKLLPQFGYEVSAIPPDDPAKT
jgi:hypothetical protein